MISIDDLQTALEQIAPGRIAGLREGQTGLSLILDVSGLDNDARDALEAALQKEAATTAPGAKLRILQTAERMAPRFIAVASGKGGVGKSTLSTNLAIAMRRQGRGVGLVDADIYGPSQTRLLNREGVKPEAEGKILIPVTGAGDLPFLSMGQLAQPGQPIAWRGPMAGNALSQLIDAQWGQARDLIVDMPPGTGDIQLSMVQKHKPFGAVIVSTPQDLALMDAARAIGFFNQAKVPIIGIIENMSGYICPHCSEVSEPFGAGGAEAAAAELGIAFLGRIPLDIAIRKASDEGKPPALDDGPIGQAFAQIAGRVSAWIDQRTATS
jgi:ATP-binding protein involved in chromosome partitioning